MIILVKLTADIITFRPVKKSTDSLLVRTSFFEQGTGVIIMLLKRFCSFN